MKPLGLSFTNLALGPQIHKQCNKGSCNSKLAGITWLFCLAGLWQPLSPGQTENLDFYIFTNIHLRWTMHSSTICRRAASRLPFPPHSVWTTIWSLINNIDSDPPVWVRFVARLFHLFLHPFSPPSLLFHLSLLCLFGRPSCPFQSHSSGQATEANMIVIAQSTTSKNLLRCLPISFSVPFLLSPVSVTWHKCRGSLCWKPSSAPPSSSNYIMKSLKRLYYLRCLCPFHCWIFLCPFGLPPSKKWHRIVSYSLALLFHHSLTTSDCVMILVWQACQVPTWQKGWWQNRSVVTLHGLQQVFGRPTYFFLANSLQFHLTYGGQISSGMAGSRQIQNCRRWIWACRPNMLATADFQFPWARGVHQASTNCDLKPWIEQVFNS